MKAFIYFVALACVAMAVTAVPDAAPWVGSWSMGTSSCSTLTCCCVTGALSVTSTSSTSLKVLVALEGQCGGQYSAMATVATPQAGATTITFSALGMSVTATKQSTDVMQASAGAGCGSASFTRGTAEPATWTGEWTVTSSTCPQASCCCVANKVNVVADTSSSMTITAGLAGNCAGQTSASTTALIPSGGSSFAFDAMGMTVKAAKTGENDMKAVGQGSCGEAQLHRSNAGFVQTVSAFLILALIVVAAL